MIINIPHLEKYPPAIQSMLKFWIKDIIDETFIFPADGDYLNARWLRINDFHRAFFWAALQAIEKYLKANLLYHGVSVKKEKENGHHIVKMARKLETYDKFLKNTNLVPRAEHEILLQNNLWGSSDIYIFLETIEKYGAPENRYNIYGSVCEFSHLFKLDHVIYTLRSNVTKSALLHKIKDHDRLTYYAYEQNYYFAPLDYKHQSIQNGFFRANISVPSIESALKGKLGYQQVFEKWLRDYIQINDKQINEIKKVPHSYSELKF